MIEQSFSQRHKTGREKTLSLSRPWLCFQVSQGGKEKTKVAGGQWERLSEGEYLKKEEKTLSCGLLTLSMINISPLWQRSSSFTKTYKPSLFFWLPLLHPLQIMEWTVTGKKNHQIHQRDEEHWPINFPRQSSVEGAEQDPKTLSSLPFPST